VKTTVNRWIGVVVGGAVVGALAVAVVALTDGGPSPATGSGAPSGSDAATRSQQEDPKSDLTPLRTITVQGHGSVKATPDTVVVSIGVQTQAAHANDALKAANTKMQVLLDTLKASGVAADDITTTGVSLYPQYDNNGRQITGYQASNTVNAEIHDVAKAGKVIDDVAGLVGDEFTVSNVSFTIDDPSTYEDQARAAAIADAKSRAEVYAAAAGVKVGEIVQISEVQVQTPLPYAVERAAADSAAGGASVPLAPGQQEVSLDTTVVYQMTS
jgi:uncharacterized protein YggE